jgi:hypothetical protein
MLCAWLDIGLALKEQVELDNTPDPSGDPCSIPTPEAGQVDHSLKDFRANFYKPGLAAHDYDQVIKSYKRVLESKKTCR